MASAFTQYYAGDRIEAESAGSRPATEINPLMVKVMEEKGIDMAFRKPKSVKDQIFYAKPDLIISMDRREAFAFPREIPVQEWSTPDPIGKPIETMRQIRDDIEKRIKKLICQ
jgi:protein-tyrosine-phosphatase